MKVLVLLGGDSPEREVSLRSGKAVAEALTTHRHQVLEYDPIKGYDGLANFLLLPGNAFDRQKTQQALNGKFDIEEVGASAHRLHPECRLVTLLRMRQ